MSSKAIAKAAGRALSTVAVSSHCIVPKVILSDFASRIVSREPKRQSVVFSKRNSDIEELFLTETTLDPRDFGYRVVAPVENAPIYTSTDLSSDDIPVRHATKSTLGKIVCSDQNAAEEVMAAQREWDTILDMEQTRPHFEFWKEDPYNISDTIPKELFEYIDSHGEDDLWEEAV